MQITVELCLFYKQLNFNNTCVLLELKMFLWQKVHTFNAIQEREKRGLYLKRNEDGKINIRRNTHIHTHARARAHKNSTAITFQKRDKNV